MSDIAVDDIAILQGDKCRIENKNETVAVTESDDGNSNRNTIFHDESNPKTIIIRSNYLLIKTPDNRARLNNGGEKRGKLRN